MVKLKDDMDTTNTVEGIQNNGVKMRPINCELNSLTRADGSAIFAQGSTCVIASMLGPIEVKAQNLKIEEAYIECNFRPKSGLPTVKDKLREALVRDACEAAILTTLHPRTMMSIQLQELDDRCGLEACAINAACMALLIGGAPMKYTIAAVHCIIDKNGQLILDPDHYAAIGKQTSFTFVFDSLEKHIVTVNTNGCFKMTQFKDAECMCRAASEIIFNFYRKIISKFYSKSMEKDVTQTDEVMES